MREEGRAMVRERGFSMVELMVAMTITLLIMGAVYGMLAGGQNAFRREPELAERQQNARMAMDLIMRDISNAGSGLPTFVQTFTTGLDGTAASPMGPDGARTDELEVITNSESRDTEPVCRTMGLAGGNGGNVKLMRDIVGTTVPPVLRDIHAIPFTASGQWTLRNVVTAMPNGVAAFDCTAGNHTQLDLLRAGDSTGLNTNVNACEPNGWGNITPGCEIVGLSFANIVRYRIRNDATGVPMLERWSSDAANSIALGVPNPASFQTLARGIENLQVQYLRADGNPDNPLDWLDQAPVAVALPPTYGSLTVQVRVTLASRSEALNIAGAKQSLTGGNAIRGTMTSSASPRATLMNITLEGGAPRWR